jgi:hypothetical protein
VVVLVASFWLFFNRRTGCLARSGLHECRTYDTVVQLVPGLEDLKDVRIAFAGFGCDGIVEPGVKRLVNLVNPGQACPANDLLELLVEHPDALDP